MKLRSLNLHKEVRLRGAVSLPRTILMDMADHKRDFSLYLDLQFQVIEVTILPTAVYPYRELRGQTFVVPVQNAESWLVERTPPEPESAPAEATKKKK